MNALQYLGRSKNIFPSVLNKNHLDHVMHVRFRLVEKKEKKDFYFWLLNSKNLTRAHCLIIIYKSLPRKQ